MALPLGRQLVAYGLIGIVNTGITVVVIATLTLFSVLPVVANVIGFAAGLANSYFMNGRVTFKRGGSVVPFFVSFAVAYGINLLVLLLASPFDSLNRLIPQAIAMIVYNISFFILMKAWVFASATKPSEL